MTLSDAQIERARFIRAVLAWHNVNQAGLGEILGISQQSAGLKLAGKRRFSADDLANIVDYYGLDPAIVLKPATIAPMFGGVRETVGGLVRSTYSQLCRLWATRHTYFRVTRRGCALDSLAA